MVFIIVPSPTAQPTLGSIKNTDSRSFIVGKTIREKFQSSCANETDVGISRYKIKMRGKIKAFILATPMNQIFCFCYNNYNQNLCNLQNITIKVKTERWDLISSNKKCSEPFYWLTILNKTTILFTKEFTA